MTLREGAEGSCCLAGDGAGAGLLLPGCLSLGASWAAWLVSPMPSELSPDHPVANLPCNKDCTSSVSFREDPSCSVDSNSSNKKMISIWGTEAHCYPLQRAH